MRSLTGTLTLMLMGAALLFIGCGGSSPNPNHLTSLQAQQLGDEVYDDAGQAMAGALESIESDAVRKSGLQAVFPRVKSAPMSQPDSSSCTSTSCTISFTYNCPVSGTIAVSGTANEGSSSSLTLSLTETPSSCSDGTLVLNGNPNMTLNAQATESGTAISVSISIGGDVTFAPVQAGQFPTGSCASNLQINASETTTGTLTSCTIGGAMCGISMNQSCMPPT